jgi:hypothetical protein
LFCQLAPTTPNKDRKNVRDILGSLQRGRPKPKKFALIVTRLRCY